jgi:hypothetical protein
MTKKSGAPDLLLLEGVVSNKIIDVIHMASERLTALGVRHVLIGAVAVNAYGRSRTTQDVDFLVGPEAFVENGPIVYHKLGLPLTINDVVIDYLTLDTFDAENELNNELDNPEVSEGVPIISGPALIYTKLVANRRRDKDDIIELMRLGISERSVRAYLKEHAPDAPELLERFDDLVG